MNIERETLKVWLEGLEIAYSELEKAQQESLRREGRLLTEVTVAQSTISQLAVLIGTIVRDTEPRGPMRPS